MLVIGNVKKRLAAAILRIYGIRKRLICQPLLPDWSRRKDVGRTTSENNTYPVRNQKEPGDSDVGRA